MSSRFDDVKTVALNEADDLLKLYKRACKTAPVELIDIPAQKTDFILDVLERFNVIDLAAEEGVRLTVLLFIADDPAAGAAVFLLEGEERYETREAIIAAFYDICRGDPASYPVQYALVQKAMVIGLLLGSIVAGLSFHVVTLNWPPR